jgi:ribosomal protein S27AE
MCVGEYESMQETVEKKKPVCSQCGSGQVRFRADGTALCQRCGYDSRKVPV